MRLSLLRALIIYLCASFLLAACGEQKKNTSVFSRPKVEILDNNAAVNKGIVTGKKNGANQDYLYLLSKTTPKAMGELLKLNLTAEELQSAEKLKDEVQKFQLQVRKDENSKLTYAIAFEAKSEESDKFNKSIVIKLNPINAEQYTGKFESADDQPTKSLLYSVVLNLGSDGSSASIQLTRESDKAVGIYYANILNVKTKRVNQNVSSEQAIALDKGQKLHPVSAVVEQPDSMSIVTNTINVTGGESRIWIYLERNLTNGNYLSLELEGDLVVSDSKEGSALKASFNRVEGNDSSSLVRSASIVSHAENGELGIRLLMNSSEKPEAVIEQKPTPKNSTLSTQPLKNYIDFKLIP